MNLPLFIAGRYLFASKSHNVINTISLISAAGMAVGTAALILILSVFNGFGRIVQDNLSDINPDLLVVPQSGKCFVPGSGLLERLEADADVTSVVEVVSENVFVLYDGRQCIARAKGVDSNYTSVSGLSKHLVEGDLSLKFGELDQCCLGAGLSYTLGAHPHFSDRLEIYFPDRNVPISMAEPMASLRSVEVWPGGVVSVDNETDKSLLILPVGLMRELMDYSDEVTALEVRLSDPSPRTAKRIERMLPEGLTLLTQTEQNPEIARMMRYEKAAVFLILLFVVIIVAFNVLGSLSMLIIEKKEDIATLRALGANESTVKRIFVLEGWLVSLCGLAAGLVLGVGLALLQQYCGIVKLPGSYLVDAYPVVLKFSDVLLTAGAVALVGYLIALTARLQTSDPSREA